MTYFWLIVVGAFAVFVGSEVFPYVMSKRMPSAQQQRAKLRWQFWLGLPSSFVLMFLGRTLLNSGNRVIGLSVWGCVGLQAIQSWYSAFSRVSEAEIKQNQKLDPEHCGKCGYSLTGNVSGVCPECGEGI